MTTDNHTATQHEFVRKCLLFFWPDDPMTEDEREQLFEEDLPAYAESIYHLGGYDLDQRLAALQAERDGLTKQVKDLEELRDHLSDKLQEARQFQANQRKVNAILARQLKKAEAGAG